MNIFETIFSPITAPGGLQHIVLTDPFGRLIDLAPPPPGARGAWIAAASDDAFKRFGFRMDGSLAPTAGDYMVWRGAQPLQLVNEAQIAALTLGLAAVDSAAAVNVIYFAGQVGTTR